MADNTPKKKPVKKQYDPPVPRADYWGICRKCKSRNTSGEGAIPNAIYTICLDCGCKRQICGGSNQTNQPCLRSPDPGHNRCRFHGARSGRPPVHGRRSIYLPHRLAERAEQALTDPNLISVAEDVALIEALIIDEAERIGEDTPAELWSEANKLFNLLLIDRKNMELMLEPEAGERFDALGIALSSGIDHYRAIDKMMVLVEQKRKLSETEMKRLVNAQQFVSSKELAVFMARLLNLIQVHVSVVDDRRKLGVALTSLFHSGDGEGTRTLG